MVVVGDAKCVKYQRLIRINVNKIFRFPSCAEQTRCESIVIDTYAPRKKLMLFYAFQLHRILLFASLFCRELFFAAHFFRAIFSRFFFTKFSRNVWLSMFEWFRYLIRMIPIKLIDFSMLFTGNIYQFKTAKWNRSQRYQFNVAANEPISQASLGIKKHSQQT